MDLQTGYRIWQNTVCPLPITPSVITRVNDLGKAQNITKLYFKNCNGCYFPDADWVEGVDYSYKENTNGSKDNIDSTNDMNDTSDEIAA